MTPFEQLDQATRKERQDLLAIPLIQDALAGRIGLEAYQRFLGEAFHHVRHTVPLLMLTGARLPASMEWLRGAMAHYIDEEYGHEQWILRDIQACGGDARGVEAAEPMAATELMVAYAYDGVQRRHPVRMLGMVHVLEGTSVALATAAADAIQASLGLPDSAFTYLRSHGELDREHVDFFAGLINRLEPAELDPVIHAARRFFELYGNIFRGIEAESLRAAA